MKRSLAKRLQKAAISVAKTKDIELRKGIIKIDNITKCASCPSLIHARTERSVVSNLRKTASLDCLRECKSLQAIRFLPNLMQSNTIQIQHREFSTDIIEKSVDAVKNIGSVCACPACLPPPCNTPAKCLQYMTGYYYYPYGTWFCGPYHVSTGSCPVSGPVKPGGPCGPIVPSACEPCGPACCACKPLSCCGVCGVDGSAATNNNNTSKAQKPGQHGQANVSNPHSYPYTQYDPYNSYNSYMPYGYYNNYNGAVPNFGPCINVPIAPVPVESQETEATPSTVKEVPSRKSSISWPLSKANINQDTKVSSFKNPTYTTNVSSKAPTSHYTVPPTSSVSSKPYLSKGNPYMKPRINARTLQPSNSIGICYFSTKCIRKYHKYNRKTSVKVIPMDGRAKKFTNISRSVRKDSSDERYKSKNYWSLLNNGKDSKKLPLP